MLEFLLNWDTDFLVFLNSLHNAFFDGFMWAITGTKIWIPLYLLILFFIFKKFELKEAFLIVLFFIAAVALADLTSVRLFKEVFMRFRPSHNPLISDFLHLHVYDDGSLYRGGKFGFVSSHAANTFAVAMFSSLIFRIKNYIFFIFFWASIVSYSRIYLGVHYPLDILGGALLGIFISYIFYFFLTKAQNKWLDLKHTYQ